MAWENLWIISVVQKKLYCKVSGVDQSPIYQISIFENESLTLVSKVLIAMGSPKPVMISVPSGLRTEIYKMSKSPQQQTNEWCGSPSCTPGSVRYEEYIWNVKLIVTARRWRSNQKNIFFLVLFFCLLLHRLAVTISLPFHIYSSYRAPSGSARRDGYISS